MINVTLILDTAFQRSFQKIFMFEFGHFKPTSKVELSKSFNKLENSKLWNSLKLKTFKLNKTQTTQNIFSFSKIDFFFRQMRIYTNIIPNEENPTEKEFWFMVTEWLIICTCIYLNSNYCCMILFFLYVPFKCK